MRIKIKKLILRATDELIGSAFNAVLWWLYLYGASFGKSKTSFGVYQMFRETDQALQEFNYASFKQILTRLKRQGLIKKRKKYSVLEFEITKLGKKRIAEIAPGYHQERPWDGYLYLISYDVPEIYHESRNLLRRHLKRSGCALLQESLWFTPYNPRKLLDEFMAEYQIEGTILLSKLGRDGAIGEEGLGELLERVFGLAKLNERYEEFIEEAKLFANNKFFLVAKFQRILKDDPQLPFALLPKYWLGDKAYQLSKKIMYN